MVKDRRGRDVVLRSRFFRCTLGVVFSCVVITGFTFSSFRLFFGERYHPVLGSTKRTPIMEVTTDKSPISPVGSVREAVILPDQVLLFLRYPPSAGLFTIEDINCSYVSANSSRLQLRHVKQPLQIDRLDFDTQIVRCLIPPRGFTLSLDLKSRSNVPVDNIYRWDSLTYDALIDRDNTTVVFTKGLNLRPDKPSNASKFECVYGWDFSNSRFLLKSALLSIAQEIARCQTPLSVLSGPQRDNFIKVSIRAKGKGIVRTMARPARLSVLDPPSQKQHEMCICTMLRNQARFIREWVMYHAQIGVQRWFIYDNNSNDDIESVIDSLSNANYNITRHIWPWIKTQEAGFAHCALRARDVCEWIGFIDVDEFFHMPSRVMLQDVIRNLSTNSNVGEFRVLCHIFGPSGLSQIPKQGVTVGYTCRMNIAERHKSIIRPEALNSTLINVVHHFHLRDEFYYVNVDRTKLVINHYKYQVWEVFKDKFYRRVATYVADWQDSQNIRSNDRVPGLGTQAVEPSDWSSRFCEVNDTWLRDRVLETFANPLTHLLPWQEITNNTLIEDQSGNRSSATFL